MEAPKSQVKKPSQKTELNIMVSFFKLVTRIFFYFVNNSELLTQDDLII